MDSCDLEKDHLGLMGPGLTGRIRTGCPTRDSAVVWGTESFTGRHPLAYKHLPGGGPPALLPAVEGETRRSCLRRVVRAEGAIGVVVCSISLKNVASVRLRGME